MRREGRAALQMRSHRAASVLRSAPTDTWLSASTWVTAPRIESAILAASGVGSRRSGADTPSAKRAWNRAPIGLAQAGVHALHPGLAVDKGVMNLGVNREHSIRHPVDHPTPKEWPVTIEGRLVQVGNEPQQVVVAGPGGKRQMLDVVARVPAHHLLKTGRAATQEARNIVKQRHRPVRPIRLDDLSHDGRGARRLLEQQHRPDVRGAGP